MKNMSRIKKTVCFLGVMACLTMASYGHASVVDEALAKYQAEGASQPFSATRGAELWKQEHMRKGKPRDCATCHGPDLTQSGKHARSGKVIDPMAPSVNPKRFTKMRKIKKWFKRNCKWVLGRTCTPQEKGDILTYLKDQ